MKQSVASLEYVMAQVQVKKNGIIFNVTVDTVEMAFVEPGAEPQSGDWKSASWETVTGNYYARCLVGPGGAVTLARNTDGSPKDYDAYVRITDNPEHPAKLVGVLTIF